MLRMKNTRSYACGKLIITFYNSQVHQTCCFSNHLFQAFRTVKLYNTTDCDYGKVGQCSIGMCMYVHMEVHVFGAWTGYFCV